MLQFGLKRGSIHALVLPEHKDERVQRKRVKEQNVTNISLLLLVLLNALQLVTGATGFFSQGATAVVHGYSICALDPSGESLLCRMDVGWSPPVSITQSLTLSILQSTPMKGHKQAPFHVRFIEKTGTGSWSSVTAIQWNATHKSKQ